MASFPADELRLLRHGDPDAATRALRALFWTLVYHLEPALWDQLAQIEPIHPGIIAALPGSMRTSLDVGAGSGRLTGHLAVRSQRVVAVEPSIGLADLLRGRLPGVDVVSGWAEALPITSGWSEVTAACGALGPDPAILQELHRVTAPGGVILLISPEEPERFESLGWDRHVLEPIPSLTHETWIDEFFGPPDPPHEFVVRRLSI